jgi:hypothetical protein
MRKGQTLSFPCSNHDTPQRICRCQWRLAVHDQPPKPRFGGVEPKAHQGIVSSLGQLPGIGKSGPVGPDSLGHLVELSTHVDPRQGELVLPVDLTDSGQNRPSGQNHHKPDHEGRGGKQKPLAQPQLAPFPVSTTQIVRTRIWMSSDKERFSKYQRSAMTFFFTSSMELS